MHWEYVIGADDADDYVTEVRQTKVGAQPLRLARIAPGQVDGTRFDITDPSSFAAMGWQVDATIKDHRIGAHIGAHLVDADVSKYTIIVEFDPPPVNTVVQWRWTMRWPGLWHDLRHSGRDHGSSTSSIRHE